MVTPDREVLELTFETQDGGSEMLRVTPEHPLWSLDHSDWRAAVEFSLGDRVDSLEGPAWLVAAHSGAGSLTVYNLEVADSHTYFVGSAGVWAHNTCWDDIAAHVAKKSPGRLGRKSQAEFARYIERFANTTTGVVTKDGATIWTRGTEILVRRPGKPGGTYFNDKKSRAAVRRYVRNFLAENGGPAW